MDRKHLLDRLEDMERQSKLGGGEARIERQHAAGKWTARERIENLLDPGSFTELDALVVHDCTDFGLDEVQIPGDGVVTGYGRIDGRWNLSNADAGRHDAAFAGDLLDACRREVRCRSP